MKCFSFLFLIGNLAFAQKLPKIKQVIPGHDAWKGDGHLSNTLKLLELN